MGVYEDDINIIASWLKDKNCGMWAHFDISDDDERILAAQWIRGVMADLSMYSEYYHDRMAAGATA